MRYSLILAALLLSACATETKPDPAAAHHAKCVEYGLQPRTDAYASCRQRFDLMAAQAKEMRRSVILQRMLAR